MPASPVREPRRSWARSIRRYGAQIFEVNTLAPLMMAEAFVEHVARSQERKLIAISSRLGSIALADSGRYAYRASKTALNMEWKGLSKDLGGQGR